MIAQVVGVPSRSPIPKIWSNLNIADISPL